MDRNEFFDALAKSDLALNPIRLIDKNIIGTKDIRNTADKIDISIYSFENYYWEPNEKCANVTPEDIYNKFIEIKDIAKKYADYDDNLQSMVDEIDNKVLPYLDSLEDLNIDYNNFLKEHSASQLIRRVVFKCLEYLRDSECEIFSSNNETKMSLCYEDYNAISRKLYEIKEIL